MTWENQILLPDSRTGHVLFSVNFLAYAASTRGMQLSWLQSYGPEMRGGTANCSVILSDGLIWSPLVTKPTILVARTAFARQI
jgi:2-oxoglutarate ferredoxin oxidoreductase subunit gamma